MNTLTTQELENLMRAVFSLKPSDTHLAIIIDVPDEKVADHTKWQQRREMAFDWYKKLSDIKTHLGLQAVDLIYYPNVHNNNADLPEKAFRFDGNPTTVAAARLVAEGKTLEFEEFLNGCQLVIAPTQFSATAPLKLLSKKYQFRAITMPGFSVEMIPALRLDYEEINRRVFKIKELLDKAISMDIHFVVDVKSEYSCHFDLRHRTAHASGGRFPDQGTAGNLPSGESYIVPYEGELDEKSESAGILPVQFENEIVLYEIENNIAKNVISKGPISDREREKIHNEPAYANIAELGFGVLKDFGVQPTGEILLDEKLGLHIAFGRSDHFGGAVGVSNFSSPENVVHIDRIYIPETQGRILARKVILNFEDKTTLNLLENNSYTIF